MKIVIVDCATGLLVGSNGYTNDLATAIHFPTENAAKDYCVRNTYRNHKIIQLDVSRKSGRFLDYC